MRPAPSSALAAALLALCASAAAAADAPAAPAADPLDDCRAQTGSPAQLARCLTGLRQHATDLMLDAFLALQSRLVQQAGDGEDGPRAQQAAAALRQSQRDFERLLQSTCEIAQRHLPGELYPVSAQLRCETEMLRARAATLRALAAAGGGTSL